MRNGVNTARTLAVSRANSVPDFKPVIIPVKRRRGHVYFMTDGDFIKIGHSIGPLACNKPKSTNGKPVQLIDWFPGYMDEEHNLHRYFAPLNIKGELFKRDQSLLAFIDELREYRYDLWRLDVSINDVIFGRHRV